LGCAPPSSLSARALFSPPDQPKKKMHSRKERAPLLHRSSSQEGAQRSYPRVRDTRIYYFEVGAAFLLFLCCFSAASLRLRCAFFLPRGVGSVVCHFDAAKIWRSYQNIYVCVRREIVMVTE
jgi:hypothetical protein